MNDTVADWCRDQKVWMQETRFLSIIVTAGICKPAVVRFVT